MLRSPARIGSQPGPGGSPGTSGDGQHPLMTLAILGENVATAAAAPVVAVDPTEVWVGAVGSKANEVLSTWRETPPRGGTGQWKRGLVAAAAATGGAAEVAAALQTNHAIEFAKCAATSPTSRPAGSTVPGLGVTLANCKIQFLPFARERF
jgi:hypothetical protein